MQFSTCLAGLALLASAPLAASVLTLRQPAPGAQLERNGQSQRLSADAELAAADVLRSAEVPLLLQLGRRGFMQLGPHTHVQVLQRPFARYADDLSTVLAVHAGGLRLVWRPPPGGAQWPLAVQIGALRLSFEAGEYFIEAQPPRLCISSGRAHDVAASVAPSSYLAGSCHRLDESGSTAFPESQWPSARAPYRTPEPPPVVSRKPAAAAPPAPPPSPSPPPSTVAAPTRVPAAALPPPASAAGLWQLNVVSLRQSAAAEQQAARLRAAGYAAQVMSAEVKGETWYRVRVAAGPSRETARTLAAEIEARLGYTGIWLQAP